MGICFSKKNKIKLIKENEQKNYSILSLKGQKSSFSTTTSMQDIRKVYSFEIKTIGDG